MFTSGYLLQRFISAQLIKGLFSLYCIGYVSVIQTTILVFFEVSSGAKLCPTTSYVTLIVYVLRHFSLNNVAS
jgi:hypothetical protein